MCGGLVPYCFLVIVCGFGLVLVRGLNAVDFVARVVWFGWLLCWLLADLLVGLVVCFVLFLVYGIGFGARCFRLVVTVMWLL